MMKYLKYLLLLLVFCLTGCDVTYNLTITDDYMTESVSFWYDDTKENEDILNQYLDTNHQAYFDMDTSTAKYYNKKKLAFYQAKIMFDYWQKLNIKGDFIILPVPIHKNRLKERKYNHMDLTAEEFAKLSNYKINKKFLVRIKDTKKTS